MNSKMFNMFMWVADVKYIQDDKGQILLDEKPQLSFEYDTVRYYFTEQVYTPNTDSDPVKLSEEQQSEIDQFIAVKRQEVGLLKLAVDSNGKFLGLVRESDSRISAIVENMPPTQDDWAWNFEQNKWVRAYYYKADGSLTTGSDSNAVNFTTVEYPKNLLPLEYYFDTSAKEWKIKTPSQETERIIRNRIIIDTILDYIIANCHFKAVVGTEADYAKNIAKLVKNNDVNDPNLSEINLLYQKFISDIENSDKTLIDVYQSAANFQSASRKSVMESVFKAQNEKVDELIVDTILNET